MTELVWEGKYKDGKKVAPVRIALPFLNFRQSQMPHVPKKVDMKKISKAKMEEAKIALARLGEKYKNGMSLQPPQGPTDNAFREFISKLDEENLETEIVQDTLPDEAKIP